MQLDRSGNVSSSVKRGAKRRQCEIVAMMRERERERERTRSFVVVDWSIKCHGVQICQEKVVSTKSQISGNL